jgi:hypothetical protein
MVLGPFRTRSSYSDSGARVCETSGFGALARGRQPGQDLPLPQVRNARRAAARAVSGLLNVAPIKVPGTLIAGVGEMEEQWAPVTRVTERQSVS